MEAMKHVIHCILEGLRRPIKKPVNYERVKGVTQEEKANAALFQGCLVAAYRKFTNTDPSTPKGQSLLCQHLISQFAPDTCWQLQKLQSGAQTPVIQLLEVAFGVFNIWAQAEEEERNWQEKRQARAEAKLMHIAVSHAWQPRDNLRGPKSLTTCLEVKPARGNPSNVSQPATGPRSATKNPHVHAQSANKQATGGGTIPSSKGELLPRRLCWMMKLAWGFRQLPRMKCLTPSKSLPGPWCDR